MEHLGSTSYGTRKTIPQITFMIQVSEHERPIKDRVILEMIFPRPMWGVPKCLISI